MIASAIFYVFAFVLILSSVLVVGSKNPVHSVLFLILAFFNATGLFVLLGAEFIAFILAIVYVGAVAVLFLFVVMMLDIDVKDMRKGLVQYIPMGTLVGGVLLIQLFLLATIWPTMPDMHATVADTVATGSNASALGHVLYTKYIVPFQLSGMVLLVAMMGAICLTLRHRSSTLRQNISKQVATNPADVVVLQKVETGKGVQLP